MKVIEWPLLTLILAASLFHSHIYGIKNLSDGSEYLYKDAKGTPWIKVPFSPLSDSGNTVYRPVQTAIIKALDYSPIDIHMLNLGLLSAIGLVLYLRMGGGIAALPVAFYFLNHPSVRINGGECSYLPTLMVLLIGLIMAGCDKRHLVWLLSVGLLTKESGVALAVIAVYRLGWKNPWPWVSILAYAAVRTLVLQGHIMSYSSESTVIGIGLYRISGGGFTSLDYLDNVIKNLYYPIMPLFYGDGIIHSATLATELVWIVPTIILNLKVLRSGNMNWCAVTVYILYSTVHFPTFRERLLCVNHAIICMGLCHEYGKSKDHSIPVLCTWISLVHLMRAVATFTLGG